jgi:hypothetical protein
MQIENHKEEVPFAHYEEKFRTLEPASVAERLKAGIPGTVFYVPKRFHGNADLFCQVIAGDILFLSSSSDPLTHKNDVDFHIVHLYALSTVRLVYRNFVLK